MTINESPAAATLGVSGHADPEGVSPRALTLVVRAEKGADLHAADVYEAAARAVVMLLAHPACAPGGEWEPAVSAWLAGRIRKICKRARGAAWDKAAALPGVTATSGSATVRAFVPCPTDVTPPELAKLQVQGLETSDRPLPTSPPVLPAPELIILVNPVLAMLSTFTTFPTFSFTRFPTGPAFKAKRSGQGRPKARPDTSGRPALDGTGRDRTPATMVLVSRLRLAYVLGPAGRSGPR